MDNERRQLIDLLDEGNYLYSLCMDTLVFSDARISDLMLSYRNYKLYHAIRADKNLRVLDFSSCQTAPTEICNFHSLEEVILPPLKDIIPEIKNCPNLYNVVFDSQSITLLNERSFKGWPSIDYLKFGKNLKRINVFGFAANVRVVDFSDCINLKLEEHAFQYNHYIQKIILPLSVTELPDYVFYECSNLRTVLAPGVNKIYGSSAFGGNFRLSKVVLSPEINIEKIPAYIEKDCYARTHNSTHSGVVIDIDYKYIYLFSFIDNKFYYSEEQNGYKLYDLVTFNQDIENDYLFSQGEIIISSKFRLCHAIKVNDIDKSNYLNTSYKYGDCQSNAIYKFDKEIVKKYHDDIRIVVDSIIKKVNSLNIKEIISSYHTDIDEWVKKKIGGDDTFFSSIVSRASYTDPYIETLLPSYSSSHRESAFTTDWEYADETAYKKSDESQRDYALQNYDKEKHISFLLHDYIQSLIINVIKSEKYLHIGRAREIMLSVSCDEGSNRVAIANDRFSL